MREQWDNPAVVFIQWLSTPIAHWLVLVTLLLSVAWWLWAPNTSAKRLAAVALGAALALGALQVLQSMVAV